MSPDAPTTVRLPPELLKALQAVKKRDGIPVAEQVRRAILLWLDTKDIPVGTPPATPRKRSRG